MPVVLPKELLQLADWDQLDDAGAERVARMVEKLLLAPWRFVRVQSHAAGGQQRAVAFFEWNQVEFALIPGGQVLLGYDASRPPDLTEQDLVDWETSGYGNVDDYIQSTTTPLRQVMLAPFLLEVTSHEMDTEPWWESGRMVGRRSSGITMRQVRDWAHADGFCLPTSDQWEHACRAGSRAFWWWGNRLEFPLPERNAFGLQIAWNTYRSEWCTNPDVFRGGDGGSSCCGGEDGLPTTLRLASSYFEPFVEVENESERFYGDCRRAFTLSDR